MGDVAPAKASAAIDESRKIEKERSLDLVLVGGASCVRHRRCTTATTSDSG